MKSLVFMELIFFYISLTVGTSRLTEAQIDLPRLLFGIDFFLIFFYFIVTPQMFMFPLEYVENV